MARRRILRSAAHLMPSGAYYARLGEAQHLCVAHLFVCYEGASYATLEEAAHLMPGGAS